MILREYINLLPVAANQDEAKEWAKTRKKPVFVCGKEIGSDDINLLSFANFMLLAGAGDDKTFLKSIDEVFSLDIYHEEAGCALGFIVWLSKTIEQICKMFGKVHIPPTDEERQAGVENLRFGFFGIIDWYARRMHINHGEAENTAWVRIYKCLDMETKQALYERRLMKVRANKQKAKAKSKRRS